METLERDPLLYINVLDEDSPSENAVGKASLLKKGSGRYVESREALWCRSVGGKRKGQRGAVGSLGATESMITWRSKTPG